MGELPWNEKLVSFQVNPESATIADIVRMAEELVALRGTEKEQPSPEDIRRTRGIIVPDGTEKEVAHPTKCTCERCTGIAVESLYEEPPKPTRREMKHPKCPVCGRSDPVEPTRKEWDTWIMKMPHFMVEDFWSRDSWIAWFLTMPGVPKAVPPAKSS